YVASRGRYQPGEIAAALVVQRFAALLIVVVAALLGAGRWASAGTLWAVAGTVLLGCVLLALLISHAGVRGWINAQVGRRFGPLLAGFYDAWRAMLRDRPGRLVLHLGWVLLRFSLSVAGGYVMFQAFDIQVPFAELMALSALAVVATLAPVTVNGVGITEGVFVLADEGEAPAVALRETRTAERDDLLFNSQIASLLEVQPGEMWVATVGQGAVAVDLARRDTRRIRHV
ncbi:lysylphosphatidylglycerol synthase domain-containing protein, partial [Nostoc sp. NIES-2111]